MDSLKNILARYIKQSGISQQINASLLVIEADKIIKDIIGNIAFSKIKTLYFKNNILNIVCLNSVVAQEIKLKKKLIIDTLNQKFGRDLVKDLRLLI